MGSMQGSWELRDDLARDPFCWQWCFSSSQVFPRCEVLMYFLHAYYDRHFTHASNPHNNTKRLEPQAYMFVSFCVKPLFPNSRLTPQVWMKWHSGGLGSDLRSSHWELEDQSTGRLALHGSELGDGDAGPGGHRNSPFSLPELLRGISPPCKPSKQITCWDLLGLFMAFHGAGVVAHCTEALCMFLCSPLPIFFSSLLLLNKGLLPSKRKVSFA